jgi:hypothetical protein
MKNCTLGNWLEQNRTCNDKNSLQAYRDITLTPSCTPTRVMIFVTSTFCARVCACAREYGRVCVCVCASARTHLGDIGLTCD